MCEFFYVTYRFNGSTYFGLRVVVRFLFHYLLQTLDLWFYVIDYILQCKQFIVNDCSIREGRKRSMQQRFTLPRPRGTHNSFWTCEQFDIALQADILEHVHWYVYYFVRIGRIKILNGSSMYKYTAHSSQLSYVDDPCETDTFYCGN